MSTPEVVGVTLRRHSLDVEAARLGYLAKRIGARVRRWLNRMPLEIPMVRVMADGTTIPVLDKNGAQVMQQVVPDKDVRESFDLYTKAILGLLKEQRERAKLAGKPGSLALDDETVEVELRQLAEETIRDMSPAELNKLLDERMAIDAKEAVLSGAVVGGADNPPAEETRITAFHDSSDGLFDFGGEDE